MRAPEPSPFDPFRVTLWVLAGLVAGALLQWLPVEPSPWRWIPFGVAYLVGGRPILRDSVASLREGRLSIDFLMGAAALGAAIVGEPFEGAILLFLFSLSNALEERALGRTRRAVEALVELRPDDALLLGPDGAEIGRVPVESLAPGDRIRIRPGERVPVDGRVLDGAGDVDQSAITGESIPVAKRPGDPLFAATILSGGALTAEVTHAADETLLARIITLVEEARASRAPAQHFIDRFAHPYTLAVVIGTALYGLFPLLFLDWSWTESFYRAMTLLVVASPCALVISTPAAILSGIANGARHGVLFKGGAVLDRAGTITAIAFDKTGTLTEGKPRLVDVLSLPATDDAALIGLAASVERDSEHHLARAILAAAADRGIEPRTVENFRALPGEGVMARVDDVEGAAGIDTWIGNAVLARRLGHEIPPSVRDWMEKEATLGHSVIMVGTVAGILGAMSFGDRLRADAAAVIRNLRQEGIRWITVLSGDHPEAVRAVTAGLDVDEVRAGLLPHEKVDEVRALEERFGGVAMIGDGVNDAPAMATASLGVAMGAAGTDVAIETADVVLMGREVAGVHHLLHLGRRARRIVRQNVWFSTGWMLMLVIIAGTIGIPLALAVVAHEGSTLLVVMNGLRLMSGRPRAPVAGA